LTLTSGNAAKYFSATLGLVISMVTFTYVLIFPAVIRLRYKYPHIPRPYRIPGGMVGLWVAGILTTAWAAFTTLAVIYPGLGTASPDTSLPSGFAGERMQYTLSQVIPLAVMILIGLGFYALGRRTRQQLEPGVAAAEAVLAGGGATPAASEPAPSGDGTTSTTDGESAVPAADGEAAASDARQAQPPSST
jgi:glutamate:GABA antiporter